MSAAAGRADLNATVKIATVPADEPVFVLRARDVAAAPAVRAWAALAQCAGAPIAVVEQALQQADTMDAWPAKKPADAGHLGAHEIRHLEYQHRRRGWSAAVQLAGVDPGGEIRERLQAGQQFNAYELTRGFAVALGPVTDALTIVTVGDAGAASLVEVALRRLFGQPDPAAPAGRA